MNNTCNISNPVKKALLERKTTFGTWIQMGHPAVAEILAEAGFDWITVDCEHTDIDLKAFSSLACGISTKGSVPMARVRENDNLAIRQALDAGAGGVIIPLVNNAGEAKKAVASAKYPPEGIRGFAFCRANHWGIHFDDYVEKANSDIIVIAMIESRQAVENIDEILDVNGIDGIFIGPYDMSGSYGVTGQTDHPIMIEACRQVADSCRKHGKSAGIHIVKPSEASIKKALEEGFTFIALGMDTVFLDESSRRYLGESKKIVLP